MLPRSGAALAFVLLLAGCPHGEAVVHPPVRARAGAPASVTADAGAPPAVASADAGVIEDEGRVIKPCAASTPELAAADAELTRIAKEIEALAPDADPKKTAAALTAILATPCFKLADGDADPLEFDSALSLRTWWDDGGQGWIHHYLELAPGTHPEGRATYSFLAPSPRKTLTRESAKGSPLAPILCPVADATCGHAARGWLERARQAYQAHALKQRGPARHEDARTLCAEKALADAPRNRYGRWRECLKETAERYDALPLGRFRVPTEGWLVVRGRRGHYHFCDEIRAYDLATGAAFVRGTCSGLALRPDGSVDGKKTDAKRVERSEVGRLPLENLREAALLTLLSPHVQTGVIYGGYGWALPPEIAPETAVAFMSGIGLSGSWSTAQTTLTWTWVLSGRAVASGTLTYPHDANHAASDHAVKLLQIAEAAYEPLAPSECAPAAPPSPLPLGGKSPGVSAIDGQIDPAVATETSRALDPLRSRACAASPGLRPASR